MSQKPKSRGRAPRRETSDPQGDLNFGPRNYLALGAALVFILVGFLLLSQGSITLAPILLVLGYCVLVPYGLATGRRGGEAGGANSSVG